MGLVLSREWHLNWVHREVYLPVLIVGPFYLEISDLQKSCKKYNRVLRPRPTWLQLLTFINRGSAIDIQLMQIL